MKIKNSIWLLTCLSLGLLISCSSDDDLPEVAPPVVNEFCYGPNNDIFNSSAAFSYNVRSTAPGVFLTPIQITDDNFMLNSGTLEGTGFLIELNLYGNTAEGFQTGTYIIDDNGEVGDARLSYSVQYDTNATRNTSISLTDGQVFVDSNADNFIIEITANDENGDFFHGIYLGTITPAQ